MHRTVVAAVAVASWHQFVAFTFFTFLPSAQVTNGSSLRVVVRFPLLKQPGVHSLSFSFQFRTRRRHVLTFLASVALTASGSAFAQTTGTGTITGTLSDAVGARIPNARVTVTEASTHLERSTVTNAEGLYVL